MEMMILTSWCLWWTMLLLLLIHACVVVQLPLTIPLELLYLDFLWGNTTFRTRVYSDCLKSANVSHLPGRPRQLAQDGQMMSSEWGEPGPGCWVDYWKRRTFVLSRAVWCKEEGLICIVMSKRSIVELVMEANCTESQNEANTEKRDQESRGPWYDVSYLGKAMLDNHWSIISFFEWYELEFLSIAIQGLSRNINTT